MHAAPQIATSCVLRRWLLRVARGSIILMALVPGWTAAQAPAAPFNHSATLFRLEGAHARTSCDSCHKPGRPARGLPRTCNSCHIPGGLFATTFQSATHVPTPPAQLCGDCHNQNNWTPAVMRHTSDMNGQCGRCHNNSQAPGKPAVHLPTTASCDACHTTGAWTPVKRIVHDASTVSRCSTCHNGTIASGKSASHISTSAQCDTCHTSTITWLGAQFLHDPSTWGRCSTCHNYNTARGKGANHIPTSSQCDSCHTSQITFAAVTMNHTGLNGQCSTCHGGAYLAQNAQTKPAPPNHVTTTAQCDSCHSSTTSWATVAGFDHSLLSPAATNRCADCHTPGVGGVNQGLTKPVTHVPTTRQCDACHKNFAAFKPAAMDHTGTAGACATCHNGSYTSSNAQTKSATHIPTSRSCDACHVSGFTAFTPASMDHTGLDGQCSTCHSGAYLSENAQMKPSGHLPTTAQCDTCHASRTSWATGVSGHAHTVADAGKCSTCHTPGGGGLAKPTNHIPTVLQCDTCHDNPLSSPIGFKPAKMDHTGSGGQCNTCHNGSYTFAGALKQDATHIPDTRQCDTCHSAPPRAPTAVSFARPNMTMNHTGLAGKCLGCHSGAYASKNALPKAVPHIPDSRQCDTCHTSTLSFARPSIAMNHTGLNGQCTNCHSGSFTAQNAAAKGSSPPHVPTSAQCDSCHTSTALVPGWTQVKHLATGIAGQCQVCHTGGPGGIYTLAVGEPVNHVARSTSLLAGASMSCDACHKTTAVWSAVMNHNNSQGNGSGWCKDCHAPGSAFPGSSQKKSLTHDKSTGVTDCSQSGCHRPLGNKGSTYVKWD